MTVKELIRMLEKVEDKESTVYLDDSTMMGNECGVAILERDLNDDEYVVVLLKH